MKCAKRERERDKEKTKLRAFLISSTGVRHLSSRPAATEPLSGPSSEPKGLGSVLASGCKA